MRGKQKSQESWKSLRNTLKSQMRELGGESIDENGGLTVEDTDKEDQEKQEVRQRRQSVLKGPLLHFLPNELGLESTTEVAPVSVKVPFMLIYSHRICNLWL